MWLLLFFSMMISAQPKKVLVLADRQDSKAYENFIEQEKKYISPIQYLDKNRKQLDLEPMLIKAQYHFLKGSLVKAKRLFKDISDKALEYDWDQVHREKVSYAMLRSAQLEKSPEKQKRWIEKAFYFDDEFHPPTKLFPPPITDHWDVLKKNAKKVFILPDGARNFERVLINGKNISLAGGLIQSHPGAKRLTFLSNSHLPITFKLNIAFLEDHKLGGVVLATGSCQAPKYHYHFGKRPLAYYDQGCVSDRGTQVPPINLAQKPSSGEKKSIKSHRQTFFWVGAALLAVAAAHQISQANKRTAPIADAPQIQYLPTNRQSSQ